MGQRMGCDKGEDFLMHAPSDPVSQGEQLLAIARILRLSLAEERICPACSDPTALMCQCSGLPMAQRHPGHQHHRTPAKDHPYVQLLDAHFQPNRALSADLALISQLLSRHSELGCPVTAKQVRRDMQRDRLVLNGKLVKGVDEEGRLMDELHPRISGGSQHVISILQDDVGRAELVRVATTSAPNSREATHRYQCINLVLSILDYEQMESAGQPWGHRFLERYHRDMKRRLFISRLMDGEPLPFQPSGPVKLSMLTPLKERALQELQKHVMPGFFAESAALARSQLGADEALHSILELQNRAATLTSKAQQAHSPHCAEFILREAAQAGVQAARLETMQERLNHLAELNVASHTLALEKLCCGSRTRLVGDLLVLLKLVFCHHEHIEVAPTRENDPICLTESVEGMSAETSMVWQLSAPSRSVDAGQVDYGWTRFIEATISVPVNPRSILPVAHTGLVSFCRVNRRVEGEPFELDGLIQEQLTSVNSYSVYTVLATGHLPRNSLRALLAASEEALELLLEFCDYPDGAREELEQARALLGEEEASPEESLRASSSLEDGVSPLMCAASVPEPPMSPAQRIKAFRANSDPIAARKLLGLGASEQGDTRDRALSTQSRSVSPPRLFAQSEPFTR